MRRARFFRFEVLRFGTAIRSSFSVAQLVFEGGQPVPALVNQYNWPALERDVHGGIDVAVPHSARVWDYWLGGKDNLDRKSVV